MGTHRVQLKAVLSWLVRWACHAGTRDFCFASAALVGPVQKSFFPRRTLFQIFNAFVPIAQQAGQAAMQGRLSLSLCLCPYLVCAAGRRVGVHCGKA